MVMQSTKRFKHFKHSPFSLEKDGVKAEVNETGKITLTQEIKDESTGEVVYDEIKTSASFIMTLSKMLFVNRKVSYKDEPYKA